MDNEIVTIDKEHESLPVVVEPHMRLIEIAISKGADIVQIEKLMDLQERYEAGKAKKQFNSAMSTFQSLLPVIGKSGTVDYTSNKGRTFYEYAKIEDIAKAIRPALKESELSYRFTQSQNQSWITVCCIVTHSSGHSELSELTSQPDVSGGKDPLKAIASTISYLRRYTLTGNLGIVVGGEDNDGGNNQQSAAPIMENPKEKLKKHLEGKDPKDYLPWLKVESLDQLTDEKAAAAVICLEKAQ
jgi:hypothetical protein